MNRACTAAVPYLPHCCTQIRERYELGGQPSSLKRRDLRRGAGQTINDCKRGSAAVRSRRQLRTGIITRPHTLSLPSRQHSLTQAAASHVPTAPIHSARRPVWPSPRPAGCTPTPHCIHTAGKLSGRAQALACGGVQLAIEWGEPYGGSGVDEITLKGADELHVNSKLGLKGGDGAGFCSIYKRKL